MILRDAAPAEIDAMLAATHALWSEGLAPAAYREYVATLMSSPWARAAPGNYRFLVLADGEGAPPRAGHKLYRLAARLGGERVWAGGIGAVFTLPAWRGRGLASRMLELAHRLMAERGDALSLLFSEIDPA